MERAERADREQQRARREEERAGMFLEEHRLGGGYHRDRLGNVFFNGAGAEVDDERYDYSYVDPGDEVAMAVLAGPEPRCTRTPCGG